MKSKVLFIVVAVVLVLGVGLVGCAGVTPPAGPPNDKVYIFAARPLTGSLVAIGDFAFGPVMDYWQDKVNRAGGIDVGGTIGNDKMIDLTIVDDTSDIGLMSSLLTSAINSNDYHFVLPPCSTSFLQAAAGICTGAEYVLLGAEGGCTTIQNQLTNYKYLFATLSFSTWNEMEPFLAILRHFQDAHGAPIPMRVFTLYVGDLHGFEYRDAFWAEAKKPANTGRFICVNNMSVPVDAVTVLPQLQAAQAAGNITLLNSFVYPPGSFLTVSEGIANNISFNITMVGPGVNFEFMLLPFVSQVGCNLDLQGVMGWTTWNEESGGAATANFCSNFTAFFNQAPGTKVYNTTRAIRGTGMGRFILDWWGAMPYVAGLEMFQKAIETTHSLSNADIRTAFSTSSAGSPFSTTFGPAWFTTAAGGVPGATSGGLMCLNFYHGHVGQWQYDATRTDVIPSPFWVGMNATGCGSNYPGWMIYEVVDSLGGKNTSQAIYPKPNWPYRP